MTDSKDVMVIPGGKKTEKKEKLHTNLAKCLVVLRCCDLPIPTIRCWQNSIDALHYLQLGGI